VLRSSDEPVTRAELAGAWPEADQRQRCLTSLLQDGLAATTADGRVALPH
jgi:A/G-specific adenine glycosylase